MIRSERGCGDVSVWIRGGLEIRHSSAKRPDRAMEEESYVGDAEGGHGGNFFVAQLTLEFEPDYFALVFGKQVQPVQDGFGSLPSLGLNGGRWVWGFPGALALGVANEVWMLENATYSVLSPEGFASILWKDSKRAAEAADAMKITASELHKLGIVEQVIEEEKAVTNENCQDVCEKDARGHFAVFKEISWNEGRRDCK